MNMNNTLMPAQQPKKNTSVVTYDSNGTSVTLSFNTVKKYLVSGGGNVSDQEVMMFIGMCQAQRLNPFNREAYLIKYGNNSQATMITGKDVFLKRAQKHPDFDGLRAGIIIQNLQTGEITEREGTFYISETEKLVGGWCRVYLKGRSIPSYEAVSLNEYIGRKKDGTVNDQWSKRPATMIRKVALVHALKEAFSDDLGGLYAQEEITEAQDIVLPEGAVSFQNEEPEAPEWAQQDFTQQKEFPPQGQPYEQAALFPEGGEFRAASEAAPGGQMIDPMNDPAAALFG